MSSADPRAPRDAIDQGETNLVPAAVDLLAQLPEEVRPMRLATKFPRIVNRIARDWHAPHLLQPYLTSLVVDERGDRAGFSAPILEELLRLARYHDEMLLDRGADPADERTVWNTVHHKD